MAKAPQLVVFTGTVSDIHSLSWDRADVDFSVEKVYQGRVPAHETVSVGPQLPVPPNPCTGGGGSAGTDGPVRLEEGGRYTIFSFPTADGHLEVGDGTGHGWVIGDINPAQHGLGASVPPYESGSWPWHPHGEALAAIALVTVMTVVAQSRLARRRASLGAVELGARDVLRVGRRDLDRRLAGVAREADVELRHRRPSRRPGHGGSGS